MKLAGAILALAISSAHSSPIAEVKRDTVANMHSFAYQGCYGYQLVGQNAVRTKYDYYNLKAPTVQACIAECYQTYNFAMVGNGGFCFCLTNRGQGFMPNWTDPAPDCNWPCPSDSDAMCGGKVGTGMFSFFERG